MSTTSRATLRAAASGSASRPKQAPTVQLSSTLSPPSGCTIWCARAMPWRATRYGGPPVMSWPSKKMLPLSGG